MTTLTFSFQGDGGRGRSYLPPLDKSGILKMRCRRPQPVDPLNPLFSPRAEGRDREHFF